VIGLRELVEAIGRADAVPVLVRDGMSPARLACTLVGCVMDGRAFDGGLYVKEVPTAFTVGECARCGCTRARFADEPEQ
jgi:hypothetical protein